MADIDIATYEQISTMMTHLLTYYTQLALTYQEMFYDPEPKDITVQLYDADGNLVDYTIPNRAKDFNFIKNGEGSPEGVVSAEIGTTYQDTLNGKLYIKRAGTDNTGWYLIGSETGIREGYNNPEGFLVGSKGDLYKDKSHAALYIKLTETGNTGWQLISANTEGLADTDLSNLTSVGNNKFLGKEYGESELELRELIANKIQAITSAREDKYPSEKAVVQYVEQETATLANVHLSNLSPDGQAILNNKASIDLDNLSEAGEARISKAIPYSIKYGNTDGSGNLDLIDIEQSFNTTYQFASPGTYVITVPREGVYQVEAVSGGGGGEHIDHYGYINAYHSYYTGSTGAYFKGTVRLTAGDHVVQVGSGGASKKVAGHKTISGSGTATSIGDVFTLSGGAGAGYQHVGAGGRLTNSSGVVETIEYNQGLSSIYHGIGKDWYTSFGTQNAPVPASLKGFGFGGSSGGPYASAKNGGNGFIRITILGEGSKEVNYKVDSLNPLVIVTKAGAEKTIYGINNDQLTGLSDGRYNKFIDEYGSEFLKNVIYRGYSEPSSPSAGDVWIKRTFPVEVYKYTGSTWEDYSKIYIGSVDIEGGSISDHKPRNAYICDNGFTSTLWNRQVVKAGSTINNYWYRIYSDGWCEQGGRIPGVNGTSGTLVLPIPFRDTNYVVVTNGGNTSAATFTCNTLSGITTSSVGWVKSNAAITGDWVAYGFAASTELNYTLTD